MAILLAGVIAGGAAQSLRRKPHQLRATSLAEVTIDSHGVMTARLTPITILADGTYHDASIYKNEPQPMVLDSGVVYEVQKTGQPIGFLTVYGKATKDKERGWTALGKWQAVSQPSPRAAATPTPSHPSDERPIIHRSDASSATSPSASPTVTPTPAPPTPSASSDTGSSDRPVLQRPESAATPTPSPAPTAPASTNQAETPSQPPDTDRPTLRRRTPGSKEDSSSTREIPLAPTSPQAKATPPPQQLTNTPGTQSLVAVSDAQPGDSRSFQFMWKPGEEAPIDAKLRRLALAQLAGPVSDSSLANVVIRSFDLDLSNDAVMVISAEAPPISAAPGKGSTSAGKNPATPGAKRYITLIARVDFDGNPQKLASSVTDASRLDVAPRLELIDAVDVDGDGFGELLFRQYGFDEKSFVIYQIGRFTVTKLFEGASQSTK